MGRLGRTGSLMNDSIDPNIKERQSLIAAAFFGNCPRCAERTLFDGVVIGGGANFAPKCTHCDLDYDAFNVGDGPAAFITFLMGALIVTLALAVSADAKEALSADGNDA
jgi:uncharacterized protein (DUF983 family)